MDDDPSNEFERDMLARELFLLFVSEIMKHLEMPQLPVKELARQAYEGADAFIEAGRASKETADDE